eukprot:scaffold21424_cov143-Isochrysis_galbana.AAC.2
MVLISVPPGCTTADLDPHPPNLEHGAGPSPSMDLSRRSRAAKDSRSPFWDPVHTACTSKSRRPT